MDLINLYAIIVGVLIAVGFLTYKAICWWDSFTTTSTPLYDYNKRELEKYKAKQLERINKFISRNERKFEYKKQYNTK